MIKEDEGVEDVYKYGIRAGVSSENDSGLSLSWYRDDEWMTAANGDLSFMCLVSDKMIKADKPNPLDQADGGVWFVLDGSKVDEIPDEAIWYDRTRRGAYFRG